MKQTQTHNDKGAAYIYAAMKYNFFLKKEPNRKGLCPIYLNIRIDKKRKRIPIDLKVKIEHWDKENQCVVGEQNAEDLNLILKQIESKITNIKIQHRLSETPLTIEKFVENFKSAPPNFDLVQFFEHIIDFQNLGESTKIKHKGIFNKLKKSKISSLFYDINLFWFDKYRTYLKSIGNNSTTINTNIGIIKKYLRLAKNNGIKLYVNLDWIKVGATDGRIIWLKYDEIERLEDYYYSKFIPEHLKLSLGYFLFSCYTGLRISDTLSTERKNIINSETYDFISKKSKKRQLVGINKKCKKIIEENQKLFIDKKSPVKINLNLKEIAKFCGINKKISFHTARHSFATNYLIKGGKVENLQILLGHSKITTTMKYVHIADEHAAMTVTIFD